MSRARHNPSTSVPSSFPEHELALLTVDEFLRQRDPKNTTHSSSAYDSSIASLNDRLWSVGWTATDTPHAERIDVVAPNANPSLGLVFRLASTGKTVAVLKDGVLYKDRFVKMRRSAVLSSSATRQWAPLEISQVKEVKYPSEFEPKLDPRAEYPVVLRRFIVSGERLELRAEVEPRKDRGDSIVIVNGRGQIVARGDDEWGATLLRVAKEYRGRGLGKILAEVWYGFNPKYQSGGFTDAGRANAVATWESIVRKWLSMGWYSELVRSGRITNDRVKQILSGLSKKKRTPELLPVYTDPSERDLRLYIDESAVAFVLYDARFLESADEADILGYGFLRSTPEHGMFFYRIEYEPEFKELVSAIGLQLARDAGSSIYVDAPPADLIDWQLIPDAEYKDGYVTLKRDLLSLSRFAKHERKMRNDPYRQRQYALIEAADSKWQ